MMGRLLRGIARRTVDILNLDRMGEEYHVMIVNYIFLVLYTTLESVFVNTLLYTVVPDITIVIFYRGITFVVSALAMHLAAYIGQKKSPLVVIRTGAVLYLAMYIVLFFGMDHMRNVMVFTAILAGSGGAFYWTGHNVLVPNYTSKNNRDVGIAILGIIQGVMTLLIPVISGFVISLMRGNTGYRVMFGVGMLAVVAQVFVQSKLYPVVQKKHVSQARLAFKLVMRKMSVKLMLSHEVVRGFRDGAFGFIMNMLLFEIITDESLVGINSFLSGIAAISGAWLYGRIVRPHMRAVVVAVGTAILTAALVPLFFVMNPATVMIYSVISSLISLFLGNCCSNSTFDVIAQNETMRKCMGEMIAIREGALCIGRMLGLGVLMAFPHTQLGYVQAILVLTAAQFLCAVLLHYTRKMVDRKRGLTHEPGFPKAIQASTAPGTPVPETPKPEPAEVSE